MVVIALINKIQMNNGKAPVLGNSKVLWEQCYTSELWAELLSWVSILISRGQDYPISSEFLLSSYCLRSEIQRSLEERKLSCVVSPGLG